MSPKDQKEDQVATPGLRDKVQTFRDKAREILRMTWINTVLQEIFHTNADINCLNKELEDINKWVPRVEYRLSKLDEADPDYETQKEVEEKQLDSTKKEAKTETERCNSTIEKLNETIKELNEKVVKIEAGEMKVSIDEVNELADKMIRESYRQ